MQRKYAVEPNLRYLENKPIKLNWKVISPKKYKLSEFQKYDLIYDETDLKIRKMNSEKNSKRLKKAQKNDYE